MPIDDQVKLHEEAWRRSNPTREIPEGSPMSTAREAIGYPASGIMQDTDASGVAATRGECQRIAGGQGYGTGINHLGRGENGLLESAPSNITTGSQGTGRAPVLDMGVNSMEMRNSMNNPAQFDDGSGIRK
jgi:hypothetical protein